MSGDQHDAQVWSPADVLREKFELDTGIAATSNFAAWVMQPLGDTLFIGAGNSPANEDGAAVLSSVDGATIDSGFVLDEQGVHDMQAQDSELWVCGTDPTDDWTHGNIYRRSAAGVWSKIRTLPNVIHAFGLWRDGAAIYVAAGAHTGDNATWRGRVLKSSDGGATWTTADVNNYRCYDVIGFGGRLYAVGYDWTGSAYTNDLHVSADAGATWSKVGGVSPASRPRLTLFDGSLVGVQSSLVGVFSVSSGGAVTLHSTPFVVQNQWNVLADGGDGYLYALASNGVWRSVDIVTWQFYSTITNPISIALWPGIGLMVGDIGLNARIWRAIN